MFARHDVDGGLHDRGEKINKKVKEKNTTMRFHYFNHRFAFVISMIFDVL